MKKSLIVLASICLLATGCGKTEDSTTGKKTDGNVTTTETVGSIHFESDSYAVNSGDKVTIAESVKATYSFQGGTPEGVTLNSETGEITFDAYGNKIPEKTYLATYEGKTCSTIVSFIMKEVKPTLTIQNPSDYIVDGDYIVCTAVTSQGREYSVTYSIKDNLAGVSISDSGKISYGEAIKDGDKFTVVCESQGVTLEKEFICMKDNVIFSKNEVILEKGKTEDAYFTLDFNGNTAGENETAASDIHLYLDNVLVDVELSYDLAKKEVKIPNSYVSTLDSGEYNFKLSTKRNAVTINLSIADRIIYLASDFAEIFEPNYSDDIAVEPTFKEGSLDGYYALGCDIDMSDYLTKHNWAPIGAYSDEVYDVPFNGVFNGNGYTISGFDYGTTGAVKGLFGRNAGTIKNFTLKGGINRVASWSAAVCANNKGTIENIIADVALGNEGQSATGVICSTNHGVIQNCLSINERVIGNIDPDITWRQSGLMIGLNEDDGTVKNCYAVGSSKIMGYSNNSEVTDENVGKVFESLNDMKAYDFASLPTRYFTTSESELPTLNVLSVSHNPGYFEFKDLPSYGLKGDEIALSMGIKPVEREKEYNPYVVYSITSENAYGATITGSTLSLANLTAPDEGASLTIKATLVLEDYGVNLERSINLSVYNSIGGLTITNTETSIVAGDTLKITTATTPASDVEVAFSAATTPAWKDFYFSMDGDELTISDDCPADLEITVTATGVGETVTKTFTTARLNTFKGNNQVHYKSEKDDSYVYPINSSSTISEIKLDGITLESSVYSYSDGNLTINSSANTVNDTQHTLRIVMADNSVYRAFMTYSDTDKVDITWLNNAYGAGNYHTISSLEDFNKYFAYDGQTHTDLASNFNRGNVYALTADLDFAGVSFTTIGKNLLGADNNQIFNGDFYGLGHTISNVSITTEGSSWGNGFFSQIGGEEIKAIFQDVNFDNITVSATGGNFTGSIADVVGDTAIIRNVNVTNASIYTGDGIPGHPCGLYVGGLIARMYNPAGVSYCSYNGYNINYYGWKK